MAQKQEASALQNANPKVRVWKKKAQKGKNSSNAPLTSTQVLEQTPSHVIADNLDYFADFVHELDRLCCYGHCKTKTTLMGHDCDLCKKRYCFTHCLPEVHGCGEAAKKEERTKFLHPKPAKTVEQEKDLAKAKGRLDAKLKDMQVKRLPTSTKTKKPKK